MQYYGYRDETAWLHRIQLIVFRTIKPMIIYRETTNTLRLLTHSYDRLRRCMMWREFRFTFVISSVEVNIVRIDDQCDTNQKKYFDALSATIDQIAVKNVRIFVRRQTVLDREKFF